MIIKKSRTAWGLPVGPWANQKIIILPNNIAFYKDNIKKNVRRIKAKKLFALHLVSAKFPVKGNFFVFELCDKYIRIYKYILLRKKR